MRNRETPAIVSVLVAEDLAMAVFIPLVATLLVGGGVLASIGSLAVAAAAATAALVGAIRFGESLERIVAHTSEEVVLLSAIGLVLIVAGIAEHLQVSAAVGAFLVGIALSGEVAHRTQTCSRRSATSTPRCSSSSSACRSTPRSCAPWSCRSRCWSSCRRPPR